MALLNRLGVLSIGILSIMLIGFAPVMADLTTIPMGGDVFIGEQGLKIPVASGVTLSWYTGTQTPGVSAPAAMVTVPDANNFYVAPSSFVGHTGNWYLGPTATVAIRVNDPSLVVDAWDQQAQRIITGKSVPAGDYLNFRIETNLDSVPGQRNTTAGFIDLRVKKSDGTIYSTLLQETNNSIPLTGQSVNSLPFFWINQTSGPYGWSTGILDTNGDRVYKSGVYTFWVESDLNGMMTNYKNPAGFDYAGKTFSFIQIVIIPPEDIVKIETSRDSVVKGHPFSVTITGIPDLQYYLWITNTSSMSGANGDQPPSIVTGQDSVWQDPIAGPFPIGDYNFHNGAGRTIRDDVAQNFSGMNVNGTVYYAEVMLSQSGTRTVNFQTTRDTKEKTYTMRVERGEQNLLNATYPSDQATITIQKGAVTIVAAGNQSYPVGMPVKLTGTNSATDFTYLFITGPNMTAAGGQMTRPTIPVVQDDMLTFSPQNVLEDNTWSYLWQTSNLSITPGTYTVYAVATPDDKNHLNSTEYGSVTITLTGNSTSPTPVPTTTITVTPTTVPITILPTNGKIGGGWRYDLIPTQVTQKPTITVPTSQVTTAEPTVTQTQAPPKPSPWDVAVPKIPLWPGTLPKISFNWIPF